MTRLMADWYRAIRKTAPLVLFFSSPAMCLLAQSALCTKRALGRFARPPHQAFAALHDQLIGRLDDQVDRDTLRDGGFRARLGVSPKTGYSISGGSSRCIFASVRRRSWDLSFGVNWIAFCAVMWNCEIQPPRCGYPFFQGFREPEEALRSVGSDLALPARTTDALSAPAAGLGSAIRPG